MSQIRLLIADKDALFLERFSNYLQKNNRTRFSLELFTDPIMFQSWVEKGGIADLLAISSTFYNELSIKPENNNIIILKDSPLSLIPQEVKNINKYDSAENLSKEILSICAEKVPQNNYRKLYSGVVHLILYADGSDLLNPLAQSIAYIKSRSGNLAFYLNLDELSNTDSFFTGNNPKGLSEMLYYIKSCKDNLNMKAEVCTSKDANFGVEFMRGHHNIEDIATLTKEECDKLIYSIQSRAYYNDIIISRAFRYDDILLALLKAASVVYITAHSYNSSLDRLIQISRSLPGITEKNNIENDHKVVFCINGSDTTGKSQVINTNYIKVFLPQPYTDYCSLTPSAEYLNCLNTVLVQQKG